MSYLNFETQDTVSHPDHYLAENFECIDVMQEVFGQEAVEHFCICNAFKYLWRHRKKNDVNDVEKAAWYLNKYICLKKNC